MRGLDWSGLGYGQMAGCCEKCHGPWGFIICEDLVTGWRSVTYSKMTLLRAVNFEYKMFIVVTICHQLGLNRPVSAASDSYFWHPAVVHACCMSQPIWLYLLSFSTGSAFIYSKNFFSPCGFSKGVPRRISEIFNLVWCHSFLYFFFLSIYPSGFITAVAVFRKPNAIPLCFSIDLFLNFLLSWLLVLLPSMFFLDVFFFFSSLFVSYFINTIVEY